MLILMRDGHELRREKGVRNGQQEDDRRNQVERLRLDPPHQPGAHVGDAAVSVTVYWSGKGRAFRAGRRAAMATAASNTSRQNGRKILMPLVSDSPERSYRSETISARTFRPGSLNGPMAFTPSVYLYQIPRCVTA